MREVQPGAAYDDARGRLVPLEFDEVPFEPRRAFVVSATQGPAERGGHHAGCRELLLLVSGSASVTLTAPDGRRSEHRLERPGQRLLLDADDWVDYRLEAEGTTLLVLADGPYVADRRTDA